VQADDHIGVSRRSCGAPPRDDLAVYWVVEMVEQSSLSPFNDCFEVRHGKSPPLVESFMSNSEMYVRADGSAAAPVLLRLVAIPLCLKETRREYKELGDPFGRKMHRAVRVG